MSMIAYFQQRKGQICIEWCKKQCENLNQINFLYVLRYLCCQGDANNDGLLSTSNDLQASITMGKLLKTFGYF